MTALCLALILAAFAVALPATLAARALGHRLSALDAPGVPGQLKAPPRRVPNTGGIGIFLGFTVPILAGLLVVWLGHSDLVTGPFPALSTYISGLNDQLPSTGMLLACLTALHAVGLVDDRRPLGPLTKLIIMVALAALAVVWTDSRLLTMLDAPAGGEWASVAVTVLWVVVITNAFNFLDNMDGLAAGVGAVAAACFLVTALVGGQWFVAAALAALLGSLLGFLVLNFPFSTRKKRPDGTSTGGASIFMGDGGSLIVGFLLAVLSVRITYTDHPVTASPSHRLAPLLAPLIILAIPLYDFCSVVIIRLRQGRSPFVGDLQHFSHRLTRHGLSPRAAVLVIYGCAAATGIGGIALPSLRPWQAWLVGVQTLLVLGVLGLYEWARTPEEQDEPERTA